MPHKAPEPSCSPWTVFGFAPKAHAPYPLSHNLAEGRFKRELVRVPFQRFYVGVAFQGISLGKPRQTLQETHLLSRHYPSTGANVNPGLRSPWLINRGVSPFGGDSSLLEGTLPNHGTGLLILGQHYVSGRESNLEQVSSFRTCRAQMDTMNPESLHSAGRRAG